ncbi:virulence-associated E family protein [uncultured Clostridium sp.]|uniref:virulence-associated E family protein n=1 Tax=uncultured Clostridium sp. TaxID=59620 RepID=UPI0028EB1B56|nr:virulence-associated E family protein [uncultured Clostridium sp.]
MESILNDNSIVKIKYDGQIALATGRTKTSKQWKNKNMLYSALIEKLSHTTRTPETYAEYKKMPKTDRDRIKDVGGFVGGSLKEGRRKAENVANRTLLTLDLDYVVGDVWSSIELLWGFSVVMYSTHTHASDNQRLRSVIPLSRPVLPDEYQAIARMVADDLGIDQFDDTRYTFIEGSTTGGVVVYDDKFSFSHHGSDPTSGILCNAFDLIRINKFGELDDNAKEDTPVNRLPSFTKMTEFAANDKKVKETIGKERMEKAQEDFDVIVPDEEISTEWLDKLTYTEQGKIRSTISNFSLIIENEPLLKGKIAYNEFSNRAVVIGKLLWRNKNNKEDWNDTDDSGLREFIEKYYGISSTAKCADALALSFEKHSFHPIKDYLNSLTWDGEKRVDTLFIDYLGAEDNSYVRIITRMVLTAAVARVFKPGCKFDNMLILSGKQGVGKSTIIKKLGMDWYSDSLTTVNGKEAYEQLQGVWILEMAEMMATKKADIEATKHFLSKTEDIYRVAYGRRTSRFLRQCIFIGTSNEHKFLRDRTGNRRFWPVDIAINKPKKDVFEGLNEYEIDQMWAEALELFNNGETLYLNYDEEKEAKKQQEAHSEESAKAGLIEEYLNKPITEDWYNLGIAEKRSYIHGGDF